MATLRTKREILQKMKATKDPVKRYELSKQLRIAVTPRQGKVLAKK